ncbi:MAG: 3-phosphoshikimate 1-carboxyvinyltransferase [Bacteroidales bacterium]|nr:3-phosphoshikimate 1-carboxyvinyltransferase [Bacteroidales bacterium]
MGILCYSLKGGGLSWFAYMARSRAGAAVEIRLDGSGLSEEDVQQLFRGPKQARMIATCHVELPSQVDSATRLLSAAILAGADYVDIPVDFPENTRRWLMNLALNHGCQVILSYHNYSTTLPAERLLPVARQALYEGADIVKIVTTAHTVEDAAAVLSLYDHIEPERLIAFAMGEAGRESRLLAFQKGAPFLYIAPCRSGATADGQPAWADLLPDDAILLRGEAPLPASKSYAQRAILLAALAKGTTRLYGVTLCDDVKAAIGVARSLYADVTLEGTTLTVEGHQDLLNQGLCVLDDQLFVGESGLLARLCIPLAGLSDYPVTITGEKTLLNRRVDDHRAALRKLGLRLSFSRQGRLPVRVGGHLHGGMVTVSGELGSQVISGLLLALSQCPEESVVLVENVTSAPYISLTTYIAQFFGLTGYKCPELSAALDEDDPLERTWYIDPQQQVTPVLGLEVERDWSAGAMLLAAGAIAGDITLQGLDPRSFQSDADLYNLFRENQIDIVLREDNHTLNVRRSFLQPFYYDINQAPDLFAPLFVVAVFAGGQSKIVGIRRLRNKESDRAATFAEEFRKLGVKVTVLDDEMYINGRENRRLPGADCSSHGDHRLAMALSVAALMADGPVRIDDTACIDKSFPGFLEILEKLKTQ